MVLNESATTDRRGIVQRRFAAGVVAVMTIAIGLASRRFRWLFPAVLGKHPGDALWAMMVYWLLVLLWPSASVGRLSALAMVFAFVDEFSQLYHAPWIDRIRATTAGHLVLGKEFHPLDLVAYAIGIGLVAAADKLVSAMTRHR